MKNSALWLVILSLLLLFACEGDTIINLNNLGSDAVSPAELLVDEVIVIPSSVETVSGDSFQLKAQAYAGSVPVNAEAFFIWSSTSELVAAIARTSGSVAQIEALLPGEAEVIVRIGKAEGRSSITVLEELLE